MFAAPWLQSSSQSTSRVFPQEQVILVSRAVPQQFVRTSLAEGQELIRAFVPQEQSVVRAVPWQPQLPVRAVPWQEQFSPRFLQVVLAVQGQVLRASIAEAQEERVFQGRLPQLQQVSRVPQGVLP